MRSRAGRLKLTLVELAVLVLHEAVARAGGGRVDGAEVRLALRCLLPVVADVGLLIEFWHYAGQLPAANRQASCEAVLGSIRADLHAGGHYPTHDQAHRRLLADRLMGENDERAAREAVKRRHYHAPPRRRA